MTNVDTVKNYSPFIDLVEGTIDYIGEAKTVFVKSEQKQVAEAVLKDEKASCKLSLWENQIKMVKVGSKVKITGGYITNYQGENKLNISRSGKLEVVEF